MQRCGIGESRGLTHGVRTAVNNTTTNTGNMLAEWISGALNTHPPTLCEETRSFAGL